MATNLIENVGLVPKALYPESWNSSNSGKLDGMLTSKLREFALELRADYSLALASLADDKRSFAQRRSIAMQSVRRKKETFLAQIYRILVISCGEPPKPTDKFTWEYKEMDGHGSWKVKTLSMTPLEFYKFSEFDMSGHMSLINDPRSPMYVLVDRLAVKGLTAQQHGLHGGPAGQRRGRRARVVRQRRNLGAQGRCNLAHQGQPPLLVRVRRWQELEHERGPGCPRPRHLRRASRASPTSRRVLTSDSAGPRVWDQAQP